MCLRCCISYPYVFPCSALGELGVDLTEMPYAAITSHRITCQSWFSYVTFHGISSSHFIVYDKLGLFPIYTDQNRMKTRYPNSS